MGVKGLWNVLAPFSEKKSLHEIRGETVAVDLSGWVCDSQNVTDYYVQPKLYLRNLFFRTAYLILAEINPIFVLEGDAPALKQDVMAARNAIQFRGAAPRAETATTKRPDVGRKRFKNVLRECETLLKFMGVQCVKGSGEAEATCAQLNSQGIVDAVVSQDSDCFAYGARTVYRNFSVSSAAGGGAMAGSIDCYDAHIMYKSNGFGRNKMVALALLCGCDYGLGACGTSIATAVAFLHTVPEDDAINRLLSWVSDPSHFEERARWTAIPGRCERCGHGGRTHKKNGCPVCGTGKDCVDNGHKAKLADVKRELSLRTRAMSSGLVFPDPKIMNEFMKATTDDIDLDRGRNAIPNLIQFVKLMSNKLDWSERYCVEKFLPILTKFHLQDHIPVRTIKPVLIKKKRTPRGVPSYEVIWSDINGEYEALISDDQFEDGEAPSVAWTTTERQDLMQKYYPDLVKAFEIAKNPPKEKKSRKMKEGDGNKPKRKYNRKPKDIPDNVIGLNLSKNANKSQNSSKLNVSLPVNKLKRKRKAKDKNQKTIESFITKKRKSLRKSIQSLRYSFKNLSIDDLFDNVREEANTNYLVEEKKHEQIRYNLSLLDAKENLSELDLSDIVDNMVKKAPTTGTAKVDSHLFKLVFNKYSTPRKSTRKSMLQEIHNNCSTPRESPIRRNSLKFSANISNRSINSKVNTSFFFDKLSEDRDAFEISMEYKHKSAVIAVDCDTTVDYSLPDVHL